MNLGCTGFTWETKNGLHLLGRTYDRLGDLAANQILAVPRGVPCAAGLEAAEEAVPGRYGYRGMAALGFGQPILVDGVNDAGLMGALLHYPEYAFYGPAEPGKTPVHPGRLLAWLLSQCAGAAEAAAAIDRLCLTGDGVQGQPLWAHYLLSDRSGEALVIEPDRDGLHVYRNTIGVLSNSPGYPWHRTNLRTYPGISSRPRSSQTVAGQEIRPFGEGLGSGFGLPGDYSSPSRFVRLAFVKALAIQGVDELDGVSRMFRAFAPVELPEGIAWAAEPENYHQTLCTSVMCAESGVYYFSPAWNRRIAAVRPLAPGEREERSFALGKGQDVDYRN